MPSQVTNVPLVRVYDYLKTSTGASGGNANPISGRTVTLTLAPATTQASSINPVTQLPSVPVQSSVADGNGYWEAWVVPTDNINPSGMTYLVDDGYRTYKINPVAAGIPGVGWQSSAIVVSTPQSLVGVGGNLLPGGTTVLGAFNVQGLTSDNGGLVVAGGAGATLNASGDLAVRSLTASSGIGPYTPTAVVGGGDFTKAARFAAGPVFDVTHPTYGAIADNGVTNNQPAIAAAIAAAVAAGGGIVWFPYSSAAYGITSNIDVTAATNVSLEGPPGTTISWYGGTGSQMLYANPGSGSNLQRFGIKNLTFNTRNSSTTTAIFLQSWQYGRIEDVRCITNNDTTAVRIETNVGTTFVNNCYFNNVYGLRISTAKIGLQLSGISTCGPTDNFFWGLIMDDIYLGGIREVQYCDSNLFYGTRVSATGTPNANWYGVILNDSATPAADVGVYDEQFYGIFIDNGNGPASASAFVLNWQRQCHVYGCWTGVGQGSPGTFIKDNTSQSHAIELLQNTGVPNSSIVFTKNYGYGPISLGFDLANYVSVTGAANGSSPSIQAKGVSDPNVSVSVSPKGTSGEVILSAQQSNFIKQGGGADGLGSAPYFATGGAAADVDIRWLLNGKGRHLFAANAGIAMSGTVPTVGSGGSGTSALSLINSPTNSAGQFQVTLTGVTAGTILGVVAFSASVVAAPKVVLVSLAAPTAGAAAPLIAGADTYTTSGFTIRALNAPTNGTYVINYWVIFQPF